MKFLLYVWLLVTSTTCFADDILEIDDVSISYRKFFPHNYNPLTIDQDIDLSGIIPYTAHFDLLLPQIQNVNDINFNARFNILKYFYYKANIDLYSFKLVWYDSNDFTIPRLASSIGVQYGFINVEYTHSFYPVENQYLNNFLPLEDSLMIRLIIIGRKQIL